MLFRTKKILKIFDKPAMKNIKQEVLLIWWISSLNVIIFNWKFSHNFFIILPTSPPNFNPFEVFLAEIEFWFGWENLFSIFLSWWVFDLLSDFSRFRRHSIYLIFFFVLKSMSRRGALQSPLFWINLSSIRCKEIYATRTQFLPQFLIDVTFCSPFALKKWLT